MEQLTESELYGFTKLLEQEQMIITKYKEYARTCDDPALCEMCINMAQRHKRHYESLYQEIMKEG